MTDFDRWLAEYAVRPGLARREGTLSGTERTRRWRLRKKGEWPAHPFLEKELEANGIRNEETGCLEWQRSRNDAGYGHLKRGGKMRLVHRLSLEQKLGRPLGPGMVARHTCDNPPCFAPEHLVEGTKAENTRDMIERGRAHWLRRDEAPD